MMIRATLIAALAILVMAGCATLPDPPQVTVAGVGPLPSEGMEIRMLLKLRVQNPNDTPIDYAGASVTLDVADKTFATGLTDASGTVARFGEAIIEVPMTISMMRMARQFMGMIDGQPVDRIRYEMTGKLARRGAPDVRFESQGELQLPGAAR